MRKLIKLSVGVDTKLVGDCLMDSKTELFKQEDWYLLTKTLTKVSWKVGTSMDQEDTLYIAQEKFTKDIGLITN